MLDPEEEFPDDDDEDHDDEEDEEDEEDEDVYTATNPRTSDSSEVIDPAGLAARAPRAVPDLVTPE